MPKKKVGSFNPMQIKDGWIVKMYKDGRIRSKVAIFVCRDTLKYIEFGYRFILIFTTRF